MIAPIPIKLRPNVGTVRFREPKGFNGFEVEL